jgi:hypothetical protein
MIEEQLLRGLQTEERSIASFGLASQTILRADAADIAITFRQIGREILTSGDRITSTNMDQNLLYEQENSMQSTARDASVTQR